jgi:hypothetical protein
MNKRTGEVRRSPALGQTWTLHDYDLARADAHDRGMGLTDYLEYLGYSAEEMEQIARDVQRAMDCGRAVP